MQVSAIQASYAMPPIIQPQPVDVSTEKVQVIVEKRPSRLTIDQTKAWEEMNLQSILKSMDEEANEGKQAVMESITKAVQEGKELMKIEQGGNPLANQAKRNSEKPIYPSNITFIPSPFSVKINYVPETLSISTIKQEV